MGTFKLHFGGRLDLIGVLIAECVFHCMCISRLRPARLKLTGCLNKTHIQLIRLYEMSSSTYRKLRPQAVAFKKRHLDVSTLDLRLKFKRLPIENKLPSYPIETRTNGFDCDERFFVWPLIIGIL